MRPYPATRRLLARQRRRKKAKFGWVFVIGALLALNAYLLFIKGLPTSRDEDQAATPRPKASIARRHTAGVLGEMQGVSGIRTPGTQGFVPGPHPSTLRFDMAEAHAVAGLRTLEQWCAKATGTVARADTLSTSLERSGLSHKQTTSLIGALRGTFDFRSMRQGETFEVWRSPTGRIERFIYQKSPLVSYQVHRVSGKLVGRKATEKADLLVTPISLRVKDSLYASLYRKGESPALVMMFVDIFVWDIDFYIDTHEGDEIRILVEKLMVADKFVRYGRILSAEYRGDVGTYRAFRYELKDGTLGYFDEDGGSLQKAFLKSPLKFARISSGYGMRVHPVLGFSKIHHGIDLAAPKGTPIWAPADGTVTFSGRKGVSGNLITLRHAQGYETVFAHLHTIAQGVNSGSRVKQKQIIGTVGSTGRSTGPHLHYGMKKAGQHVNPFKQRFPPAKPVPSAELQNFRETIAPLNEQLQHMAPPKATHTAFIPGGRKDAG